MTQLVHKMEVTKLNLQISELSRKQDVFTEEQLRITKEQMVEADSKANQLEEELAVRPHIYTTCGFCLTQQGSGMQLGLPSMKGPEYICVLCKL